MNLRALGLILLVALALRTVAALNTAVINHDGPRFTMSARAILAGDWDAALNVEPRMPPLYPLSIAALSFLGLGAAGTLVSVLSGTLLVVPITLLAASMWNARVAFFAGLVVAILPELILVSADVWTEPLFFLFFFGATAATWFAGEKPSLWLHALAGLLGGLAVNTRPEGLYTLVALLGWGAVVLWKKRDRLSIAGPILAAGIWIACIVPYASWIHDEFGFWSPTANQYAVKLLGRPNVEKTYIGDYRVFQNTEFESGRDQAALGNVAGQAWYVLKTYVRASGYVFLPLLVAGFIFTRGKGTLFLSLVALGYALPTWAGLFAGLPFDDRFTLASIVALAPVIAHGLLGIGDRLPGKRAGAVSLALLVAGCSFKAFVPRDQRRLTLREAGLWIRERYGPGQAILTMDRRVEHYAEAWSERVPASFDETVKRVETRRPAVIVMYAPYVARHEEGFEEKLAARFRKVHTVPADKKRGHEVRIYETR